MINPVKEMDMLKLAAFQTQLMAKPALRYLFFELTDKCNLNCQHCGSRCTGRNNTFLEYEVIEKTLCDVASKYNPANIMVCLTGGEPLLHPAIYDVIRKSRVLGFSVGITTNGTLIDNMSARHLQEAGLDTIAVSIDGIGKTHDEFRTVQGCFDKALFGIQALKRAGIEPQAISVIHKNNISQLDAMYSLFSKLGIYSWRLVNVDPIGRTLANKKLLLDGDDLKTLFDFIQDKRFNNSVEMEVTYGCSHFVTFDYERNIRDFYFQCGAGTLVASVMANGNIGGCLDIERRADLVQGNIYHDCFTDIWENRFTVFRRNRAEKSSTCRQCDLRGFCMGDSAHTWDYDNEEPLYCVANMLMGA